LITREGRLTDGFEEAVARLILSVNEVISEGIESDHPDWVLARAVEFRGTTVGREVRGVIGGDGEAACPGNYLHSKDRDVDPWPDA